MNLKTLFSTVAGITIALSTSESLATQDKNSCDLSETVQRVTIDPYLVDDFSYLPDEIESSLSSRFGTKIVLSNTQDCRVGDAFVTRLQNEYLVPPVAVSMILNQQGGSIVMVGLENIDYYNTVNELNFAPRVTAGELVVSTIEKSLGVGTSSDTECFYYDNSCVSFVH